MDSKSLELGEKIRDFRKRAGKSQFDLEVTIDASPGSLSRIENGDVNPSKETIRKIIEALDLRNEEAASLFGIEVKDYRGVIKAAKSLNISLELDKVLQAAVDDIVGELDLLSSFIALVENNRIYAKTTTQNWINQVALKLIPQGFTNLSTELYSNNPNLMVQSILQNKIFVDTDLTKFACPAVNIRLARLLERVVGFKTGIALPINIENRTIASIFFCKNTLDDFSKELDALITFSEYVGISLNNAIKYQELERKLHER